MQLRRFTAESTPAALAAVRQALGDDAIILANRKIGDQVEIIATAHMEDAEALAYASVPHEVASVEQASLSPVDSNAQQSIPPERQSAPRGISRKLNTSKTRANTGTADLLGDTPKSFGNKSTDSLTIEQLKAAIEEVENRVESEPAVSGGSDKGRDSSVRLHGRGSSDQGNKQRRGNAASGGHFATGSDDLRAPLRQDGESVLEQEMRKLAATVSSVIDENNSQLVQIIESQNKQINQHFKGLEVNLWGNNVPNRKQHLQQLLSLGLGANLAVQLVERAPPEYSADEALRHSLALLKSTLPIGSDKSSTVPGVTIVSGSPGAGKTTVLMKLATQHVKEYGSDSIVVICADTRRIGAFEELQAYGRLLGVPTVHAHDTAEFESLIAAFNHKQLVLVDHTLPMDSDAIEIPRSLQNTEAEDTVRHLLVLSAISQSAMVDSLIERHCKRRRMQCVLTHLDANARLGELFNPIISHHLPIAYWSDAASIQKPLQKADASILIATAVAMSRRLARTADDECLIRLIQPTDSMKLSPAHCPEVSEVTT